MKKILLIFGLVLGLSVQGQVWKEWKSSVVNSEAPSSDTVIRYERQTQYEKIDMSGKYWAVEVRCENFDADDATINFGGSFYDLPGDSVQFLAFVSDSLPYTLDQSVLQTITNSDTAYFKVFTNSSTSTGKFPFKLPHYKYNKGSNTTGTLRVIFRFYW